MAFFDDDPPTQQRRSSGPPPPPRPPRRAEPDVRTRQLVALGVIVIVLVAVGLLLKSCVSSAHVNGAKDYNAKVNDLGTRSISDVSQALELLTKTSQDPITQAQSLSQLARDSSKLTDQARKISTPGGLEGATQAFATSLSLRSTALARIGQLIGKAKGTSESESESSTANIAGQMEALLASDVLWQLRVTPFIKQKFQDLDISTDNVESSVVLKDSSWINPTTVSNRIGGQAPADAAPDVTAQCVDTVAHGHGLGAVLANGKTLQTGGAVTTVPNSTGTSFTVNVINQGDADETNVSVVVTGKPRAGGKGFSITKKLGSSPQGKTSQVVVNLTSAITGSYDITVDIKKVNCEKNTDNNKDTFGVIFG